VLQSPFPFSQKSQGTTRTTKMRLLRTAEPLSLKGTPRCRRTSHSANPRLSLPGEPPAFKSSCHIKANIENHYIYSSLSSMPPQFLTLLRPDSVKWFPPCSPPLLLVHACQKAPPSPPNLQRCDITFCHSDSSEVTASHGDQQIYPFSKQGKRGQKQGKGQRMEVAVTGWRWNTPASLTAPPTAICVTTGESHTSSLQGAHGHAALAPPCPLHGTAGTGGSQDRGRAVGPWHCTGTHQVQVQAEKSPCDMGQDSHPAIPLLAPPSPLGLQTPSHRLRRPRCGQSLQCHKGSISSVPCSTPTLPQRPSPPL